MCEGALGQERHQTHDVHGQSTPQAVQFGVSQFKRDFDNLEMCRKEKVERGLKMKTKE